MDGFHSFDSSVRGTDRTKCLTDSQDLDLALPGDRTAIRARHSQIKTQADALVYVRSI
jgi:hypothetical protein